MGIGICDIRRVVVLGVVVEIVVVVIIVVVIWQYIVTVWGGVGPQMSLRCLCRALSANDAAAVVCNALFTTLGQQLFSGVRFFLVSCASLLWIDLARLLGLLHLGQLYTCYW